MVTLTHDDRAQLQSRTVRTLIGSQIVGGVGLAAGIAVGSLLAEDVSGSTRWAGLGGTFQVTGAALIAVPLARVMAHRGRRPGLMLGYALALLGAAGLILSGVVGSFAMLLLASLAMGGATASNSQSRFAAADLSRPERRGRDLSVVVWATTIGSVLGPNLAGPGGALARVLGLPPLTGPFLFSVIGFALAIAVLHWRLRPDPLMTARALDGAPATSSSGGSVRHGLAVTGSHPLALLGLLAMALGHATMVAVMVMTPLHMRHGEASLRVIGLVISVHVLGMFALSPLVGALVDRVGGRAVVAVGSLILVVSTLGSALAPQGGSVLLAAALFGLGLGWSCTLVAGSTLLTEALSVDQRPGAQGGADVAMGIAGGGAGALAGVVVDLWGYSTLAFMAMGIAVAVGLVAVIMARPRPA